MPRSSSCRTSYLNSLAAAALLAPLSICFAQAPQPQPQPEPSQQKPPAPPQEPQPTPPAKTGEIDARANELLQKTRERLAKARTAEADIKLSLTMGGPFGTQTSRFNFAMQRPNKFAIKLAEGEMGENIISDGQNLYVDLPAVKRYVKSPAPASIDELFKQASEEPTLGSGPLSLMGPLLLSEKMPEQFGKVASVSMQGQEEIEGEQAQRVRMVIAPNLEQMPPEAREQLAGRDLEMLVDFLIKDGQEPFVHSVKLDLSSMMKAMIEAMQKQLPEGAPEMAPADADYRMELTFSNWRFNHELPAERFSFTPPEGSQEAASFMEAVTADFARGEDARPADDLLGKPAPELELTLLEGGTISLAAHKDRDIVILDFWATWCAPCVKGLPTLIETADGYRDRNVVLYAINQAEPEETVRKFLEKKNLKVKVPMDRDRSVARKYKVTGIPQTVIIGKDGTVQAVHVGIVPKEQLQRELDELLAGRKLVDEPEEDEDAGGVPGG